MIPDLTDRIEPKVAHTDMGSTMFDYVLQNNLPAVVLMKGEIVNIQIRTSKEPVHTVFLESVDQSSEGMHAHAVQCDNLINVISMEQASAVSYEFSRATTNVFG
ncbi:hypothetical protein B0H13DRAFT_2328465 [Mycena leptocephala]|nr:hypothetical protein B0H13DRAFT_2328465 [Mycena leptocephala]